MRQRKQYGEIKKECSKCGSDLEEKRIGKHRYCLKCHAEHMRNTRPKHSDLPPLQRLKANARAYLREYIKRGIVKKETCGVCGNPEVESHHLDYANPLNVVWRCREHHLEIHKNDTNAKSNQ